MCSCAQWHMQQYLEYDEAQAIVAAQNLKNQTQWLQWSKTTRKTLYPRIPACPQKQ